MRPYKSFVLPFSLSFSHEDASACSVFKWGGMKGRVIYKCIKNECIYEVLFSSHSLLAIVMSLYPSFCAYKALQNSFEIVFIPFEHRGAANAGSKQTVCLISTVSSCFLSCDRRWFGQQCGFTEHRGRR